MVGHITTPETVPIAEFHYTNLKTPQSFRLLRILAASSGLDDINCTLEDYNRDDKHCPPYAALSYTWGDADVRTPIKVNGATILVTTNLYDALLRLRRNIPNILIWIDALCIDQQNPAERGHQVAQMRAIYSGARRVLSWLGLAPSWTIIAELFDSMKLHYRNCISSHAADGECSAFYEAKLIGTLRYLTELPYWSRIWIVQEVVVASNLTLMCGEAMIPWRVFARFVKLAYYGHFGGARHGQGRLENSPKIFKLMHWRHAGVTLTDTLAWTSKSLATASRDRIYALLGLVDQDPHIEADYTLSTCALYSQVICGLYVESPSLFASAQAAKPLKEISGPNPTPTDGMIELSAQALVNSNACEDATRPLELLFPRHWDSSRKQADEALEADAQGQDSRTPCSGEGCSLSFVLDQAILLNRAESDRCSLSGPGK